MCHFVSWIEHEGRILFLTDTEVFSDLGRLRLAGTAHNDIIGHGAIRAFYGLGQNEGFEYENTEFWSKNSSPKFPEEIAKYLKSPRTLLATWGRILVTRGTIDLETVYSILEDIKDVPKKWKKTILKICIDIILGDPNYSERVLDNLDLEELLSRAQKNQLIEAVSKDADYSYSILDSLVELTRSQRNKLVKGVSISAECSYDALINLDELTRAQKNKLIESILKSAQYSSYALNAFTWLTKTQKNKLRFTAGW